MLHRGLVSLALRHPLLPASGVALATLWLTPCSVRRCCRRRETELESALRTLTPFAFLPRSPPANIMFDKRVVRGSTCTGVKNAEIVRAIQEEAERQSKVNHGAGLPQP